MMGRKKNVRRATPAVSTASVLAYHYQRSIPSVVRTEDINITVGPSRDELLIEIGLAGKDKIKLYMPFFVLRNAMAGSLADAILETIRDGSQVRQRLVGSWCENQEKGFLRAFGEALPEPPAEGEPPSTTH